MIRITKIYSKDGKIIAEAGPQKQLTKKIVKGEQAREKQVIEAKKAKEIEAQKIKKSLKKIEAKQKVTKNIEKKDDKKKSLTNKKK